MQNDVKKAIKEMSNTLNNAPGQDITMDLYRDFLSKLNDIEKCYEEEKKRIMEQLEEVSFERYGNQGMGGELVVNFDDVIEIVKGGVDNG